MADSLAQSLVDAAAEAIGRTICDYDYTPRERRRRRWAMAGLWVGVPFFAFSVVMVLLTRADWAAWGLLASAGVTLVSALTDAITTGRHLHRVWRS